MDLFVGLKGRQASLDGLTEECRLMLLPEMVNLDSSD